MNEKSSKVTVSTNTDEEIDPINDIIDYLVRCANISFKNAHVNEAEIKTSDKVHMAQNLYRQCPTEFLLKFGKYLAPQHLNYFENIKPASDDYRRCVDNLKRYHSEAATRKRIRNRRYKALQKMQQETDYFSEKEMMFRNPLLYEQLVGQYLDDDEIRERDGVDNDNLTFLSMILDTVDRNEMRETKNKQMLQENSDREPTIKPKNNRNTVDSQCKLWGSFDTPDTKQNLSSGSQSKQWGSFDTPDTKPSFTPEKRKQTMISAPERRLLKQEFLQEMYSSFIDGHDVDVDYSTIDNDEQYDDLQQVNQDEEDKYFDSETNDVQNLEEHMKLMDAYGNRKSNDSPLEDPLDEYMKHLNKPKEYN